MNIQQLKFALEVEMSGSITRAAENLFVSQPNLSSSLKDLEQELGITLFERTRRGMVPTPEGREFLIHASSIIGQMDDLENLYKQNRDSCINLRFASTRLSSGSQLFNSLIGQFSQERPMRIHYHEMSHLDVLESVARGDAELGRILFEDTQYNYFVNQLRQRGLTMELLWRHSSSLLMSRESPLAKLDRITKESLKGFTLVVYGDLERPEVSYVYIRRQLKFADPTRVIHLSDRATLMELLSDCPQCYFWILGTTKEILDRYNLVIKRFADTPMYFQEVLIYPEGRPLSREAAFVMEHLKSIHYPTEEEFPCI